MSCINKPSGAILDVKAKAFFNLVTHQEVFIMRNYSDSENSYNKKEQDSYRNQAVNCHSTKEENSATNCHRDKDTSEKNSKDEWKNASNSGNAAKSYQARNAADNCKRQ